MSDDLTGAELPVELVLEDEPDELDPVPRTLNDSRQEEDVPYVHARKVGRPGFAYTTQMGELA